LVRKDAQGNLWVSNALGADIRRLSLADASGRLFRAYDLPAGSEKKLEAVGGPPASGTGKVAAAGTPTVYGGRAAGTGLSGLRSLFLGGTDAWLRAFRSYVAADLSGSTYVGRKVSYMAVLASSPFMETPLAGARSEDTAAIVIGVDQE
jgi:hypothetical protein